MGTIRRLSPFLASNLVTIAKATTSNAVNRGDPCYVSGGVCVALSAMADGTSTHQIGIAENTSPAGSSRQVSLLLADGVTEYLASVSSSTMTVGKILMWKSGGTQTLVPRASAGQAAIAECVEDSRAAAVTATRVRFLPHVVTK